MKAFLSLLLSSALLPAQVLGPVTPTDRLQTPTPSPPASQPAATPAAAERRSALGPELAELPVLDPTNKTVSFQGRSYSLLDNHLGGQFEAYLASTEAGSEESVKYRALLQEILDLVSPTYEGGPQLREAYDKLEKAVEYSQDGGMAASLANSIYSALLSKRGQGNKKDAIGKLNTEQQRLINNLGVMETSESLGPARRTGGNRDGEEEGARKTNPRTQTTEYIMMQKRLAEIELLKKEIQANGAVDLVRSKIQYQALMVQLFVQRRFQHVIIAARFYNLVYEDGDQKLNIKEDSEVGKFFSQGIGINPTVAGLDAASNEAIRKVTTLVDAFDNNLKNERLHAGSERLMEAYAIGEFLPVVQTVTNEKKSRVQQYVQDSNGLIEALSARDLATAETLNEDLKSQARDYSAAKASAYISGLQRGSDGKVRAAKMALLKKEDEAFETAMKEAIELWPNNPAIGELNDVLDARLATMADDQDLAAQTLKEFDSLLAAKSYRAMVEEPRKSRFVVVLGQLDDQIRLDQLNRIAESITEITRALEKAKMLESAGQPEAAWEAVNEAQIRYFDDPQIADVKSRLAGAVAPFTNALSRAQNLEEQIIPQTGSAAAWYLEAQRQFPSSKYAKEGLQRLLSRQFSVPTRDDPEEERGLEMETNLTL